MDRFTDRVVLITGAGSGIGRELTRALAAEGARLAAVDVRPDLLADLAADLSNRPFASAVADVVDAGALRAAVADLEGRLGPTDVLIANAGIGRETPAATFKAEDFAAQVQVNLIGAANSVDAVLPGMLRRRRGHLVAVSSLASYRGLPLMAGYCASKAGVNALFDSLRVELEPLGVATTILCPGFVRTPLTAGLSLPDEDMMPVEEAARRMLAAIRARRRFAAFPAASCWQVRLLRYLPRPWSDALVRRFLERLNRKPKPAGPDP
jgi:NAD(P)-dependent dehydrogenase (short-subunit alcohol dehydrogenase family)